MQSIDLIRDNSRKSGDRVTWQDWFVARAWLYVLLILVAMSCGPSDRTFEMTFWAEPQARSDRRVVRVVDHCCCDGEVALAHVVSMPAADGDPALKPELVVELSPSGEVIRRWSIPIDSIVAAVSGDALIIPSGEALPGKRAFAISADGAIAWTTISSATDNGTPAECPSLPQFQGSAYMRCFDFRDMKSGALRRIAYEGPCT